MRDPERIPRVLDKLEQCWSAAPDWRLCQLLSNLAGPGRHEDIFYWEDDEVEELLDKLLHTMRHMNSWYEGAESHEGET